MGRIVISQFPVGSAQHQRMKATTEAQRNAVSRGAGITGPAQAMGSDRGVGVQIIGKGAAKRTLRYALPARKACRL